MKKKPTLAAALIALCATSANASDVATYLAKMDALREKGVMAMSRATTTTLRPRSHKRQPR